MYVFLKPLDTSTNLKTYLISSDIIKDIFVCLTTPNQGQVSTKVKLKVQ